MYVIDLLGGGIFKGRRSSKEIAFVAGVATASDLSQMNSIEALIGEAVVKIGRRVMGQGMPIKEISRTFGARKGSVRGRTPRANGARIYAITTGDMESDVI